MVLRIPVVSSDDCERHDPQAEIWIGIRTVGTEVAARVSAIRTATVAAGAPAVIAEPHDDAILSTVHSPELLAYLRTAWQHWESSGLLADPGQDRVVPYFVPMPEMRSWLPLREPAAVHARAGAYCYDTMTLIGPGTWEAARASVDVALTAADLVQGGGAPAAYGLCRPPGHHATRSSFGGSCYLNNAAIAAEALVAGGASRVAIIDIDAHHGNGTQSLFYERPDVFYASLHVDPGAGWFPHVVGFADETGRGAGSGATLNLPLAPGTPDRGWLAALGRICEAVSAYRPDAVVLSLGVDAAAGDPESPLQVTASAFAEAGRLIGELGPCVAIQEGGYDLAAIGDLVVAVCGGLDVIS
jgi:acetoin utilization deacetylase AcuC-like enzyme